ncbi:MAG: SAM-dependent methyltransferase, partial [Firmicutes bacterium]|nr:SAM-dependent methyltransferase [Bacillota bacterium]
MFVKGAKELAEAVSVKTKKTASTVKIELEIKKAEQEMDKAYRLFKPGMKVLDLGAAPGSWTLYAAERVGERGRVIGA